MIYFVMTKSKNDPSVRHCVTVSVFKHQACNVLCLNDDDDEGMVEATARVFSLVAGSRC